MILYGDKFIKSVIKSFKECKGFVEELCQIYPECIGDYDKLDEISRMVLEAIGKHYKSETIHRSYRLLVEEGTIIEPSDVTLRKQETEGIMHDINQWDGKTFTSVNSHQSMLVDNGEGIRK